MYLGHPPPSLVYLLLCVITGLFFVICNLALRDAASCAPQRSGFSGFLFPNRKRGSDLAARSLVFVNSRASWFISARAGFFWIRGCKWRARNPPKAAARRSPARPSYWHLVSLLSIINQAVLKDSVGAN